MKKYLIPALALAVLFGATGVSKALAGANDWYINLSDGGTGTTTVTMPFDSDHTRFLTMYGATGEPRFYTVDDTYLTFDDVNNQLHVNDFPISKIVDLQSALDSKASASDLSTLGSSLSSLGSSLGNDETQIANLFSFKNKFASSTPINVYLNNATTTQFNHQVFTGTVSSGQVVFNLTKDGTTNGTAICTGTPIITMSVDDPNNTYGLGKTLSNSDKNLTIAVNSRSFTSTTILGLSVLGGSTLVAAANGTAVTAIVDCN